jgi:uncharacterized phiE125 gp8 family phage protein
VVLLILKVITPPETEPITLAEAKTHCRIDGNEEDSFINGLITSAREYSEGYQNRAYVTQTLEQTFDRWPCFPVDIPRPPLVSVASVKYFGTNNAEYVLGTDKYFVDVDSEPGRIALNYSVTLPTTTLRPINAVKIRYTAGASSVPKKFKQAMFLLIGYWFENREAAQQGTLSREIMFSVHSLLDQDRVVPI